MDSSIDKLLKISSDPLARAPIEPPTGDGTPAIWASPLAEELLGLLGRRNGFYAFASALLVRPLRSAGPPLGIVEWNEPATWKFEYRTRDLANAIFFAEDLFGVQHYISPEGVHSFEPERGSTEAIAASIEGWAKWLLSESQVRTGWPLGMLWQQQNRPLNSGERLGPKVPFILGGSFTVENLSARPEIEGMRFRGNMATQLEDVPDGGQVIIKVVP